MSNQFRLSPTYFSHRILAPRLGKVPVLNEGCGSYDKVARLNHRHDKGPQGAVLVGVGLGGVLGKGLDALGEVANGRKALGGFFKD